jgi:hypothetical protein
VISVAARRPNAKPQSGAPSISALPRDRASAEAARAGSGGAALVREEGRGTCACALGRPAGFALASSGRRGGRVGLCDKFCALLRCGSGRAPAGDRGFVSAFGLSMVLGNSRPPGMTRIWKSARFSLVFGGSQLIPRRWPTLAFGS